jgi:5-methylcytosine-specific restriction endonuclease McrA
MSQVILLQQQCYGWYSKQPIPTPARIESSEPIPQLVLLPKRNRCTKNYRRKIKLINEYGCVCARCYSVKEVHELTLDHIHPKFACPKKYYNIRQNWQLLCKGCHKLKSSLESLFIARMIKKIIESVHFNADIINIKEIIQEFKQLIAGLAV